MRPSGISIQLCCYATLKFFNELVTRCTNISMRPCPMILFNKNAQASRPYKKISWLCMLMLHCFWQLQQRQAHKSPTTTHWVSYKCWPKSALYWYTRVHAYSSLTRELLQFCTKDIFHVDVAGILAFLSAPWRHYQFVLIPIQAKKLALKVCSTWSLVTACTKTLYWKKE